MTSVVKGFVPGSVIWIRCNNPVAVVASLDDVTKRILAEKYYVILTTPEVEIDELDAETLKAIGLRKIPKAVPSGPDRSA